MSSHKNLPKFNDSSYAHFVTTRTYHRYRYFESWECAQILEEELQFYSTRHSFDILGYVIMPDHLHLLL